MTVPLTPDDVLKAYMLGYFPMAETRDDDTIFWVQPDLRGVLPLDGLHISRSLRKTINQNKYLITIDRCFEDVMHHCAAPASDRQDSWINTTILNTYITLHQRGFAHSVETWDDDTLVGGLYGVGINGAFFGESMFSRANDASKVALVALVARLKIGGYTLLDTQFQTPHLASLGVIEMPKPTYLAHLKQALYNDGNFYKLSTSCSGSTILQSITQTS